MRLYRLRKFSVWVKAEEEGKSRIKQRITLLLCHLIFLAIFFLLNGSEQQQQQQNSSEHV